MFSRKRPYPFADEQHHAASDHDDYQSSWQGQQIPIPNQVLDYGYDANNCIPAEPIDFFSGPLILDDDAPFLFDQPRWLQPIHHSINGNGGHDVAESTGTPAEEQNPVCFGTVRPPQLVNRVAIELTPLAQIVDVRAQVRLDPPSPCYDAANLPCRNFEIVPHGVFYALDSSKFAVLNKKNCEQIHLLLNERELQLRAFVPHEEWARVVQCWKKEGATTLVGFDLNIYGLRQHAAEVGRILSSASLYLQRPLYGMDDYVYYNPHYLHAEEVLGGRVSETPIAYAEERTNTKNVEKTALEEEQQRSDTVEIGSILNSLSHHSFLVKSIADRRIKTNLKE